MATDQVKFNMVCDGCVEIAVNVAAGSPTVTVVDTNGTLGTVTAGNSQTFNDYLVNGNSATISIPDGNTVASGKITGTIKYTVCPTPTAPPPTATAGPTPTPSPTPSAISYVSGNGDCNFPVAWPAYGSGNQYIIGVTGSQQWFSADSAGTRTVYMIASGQVSIYQDAGTSPFDGTCENIQGQGYTVGALAAGVMLSGQISYTGFAIGGGFGDVTGPFRIWVE
jgi:hypothetical protein